MTLLRTEGWDWLQTSDLTSAYGAFTFTDANGATITNSIETGRDGSGNCYRLRMTGGTSNDQDMDAWYTLNFSATTISNGAQGIFGFAFRHNGMTSSDAQMQICVVHNGDGTAHIANNLCICMDPGGHLVAGTFTDATTNFINNVYGIGTHVLGRDIWNYIEVKFTPNATTGAVEVHVNGVQDINVSGIDTVNGNDSWNSIRLGGNRPYSGLNRDYDDFYMCDALGSTNNNFLGDIEIQTLKPDGNGNTSNLTGSDGNSVDNYLLVDDGGAIDNDTTYVESSTSSNKDTYTHGNLTADVVTVHAAVVKIIGRKTTGGSPDLLTVARSSTSETDSSALGMTTDYAMQYNVYETDPNGGGAWTDTAIDAAEFGVKIA